MEGILKDSELKWEEGKSKDEKKKGSKKKRRNYGRNKRLESINIRTPYEFVFIIFSQNNQ